MSQSPPSEHDQLEWCMQRIEELELDVAEALAIADVNQILFRKRSKEQRRLITQALSCLSVNDDDMPLINDAVGILHEALTTSGLFSSPENEDSTCA